MVVAAHGARRPRFISSAFSIHVSHRSAAWEHAVSGGHRGGVGEW